MAVIPSRAAARAGYLLVKLRARRLLNFLMSASLRRRSGSKTRGATVGKGKRGWVLSLAFGALLLLSYLSLGFTTVQNLEQALGHHEDSSSLRQDSGPGAAEAGRHREGERLPPAPGTLEPEGYLRGATLVLSLLFLAAFFVSVANREFTQPEWDLEWLVTLPVPLSALLRIRVIERATLNIFGLFAILPFALTLAGHCQSLIVALVSGVCISILLLYLLGLLQTLIESTLRLSMPPGRRRNIQALFSILGLVLLYLAMSVGLNAGRDPTYFLYDWARRLPAWTCWLPTGLAVRAVCGSGWGQALPQYLLLACEVAVAANLVFGYLGRKLARGVVAAGARESGSRGPGVKRPVPPGVEAVPGPTGIEVFSAPPARGRLAVSPIQAKELRLLSRDRNFLIQTLVLPVVIGGLQVAINPGILEGAASAPKHLAAFAFGITAYVLMFSAFQVLNAEGGSLWLVYTFPHRLEWIVTQKALLWACLSLVYPVTILGLALAFTPVVSLDCLGLFAIVLIGIPIYAVIAACLGVIGANPLDPEIQRRVRPQQAYLYMILASLYTYALYAGGIWERVCLVTLTALVAFALWQKARDVLPYLLDPVSLPPARASLSDGLIAAQLFFVAQGLAALFFLRVAEVSPGLAMVLAFGAAGVATFSVEYAFFLKRRVSGIPRFLGPGAGRAAIIGVCLGTLAAGLGAAYIHLARRYGLLSEEVDNALQAGLESGPWLFALAVLLAPVFEEFIFRGLIFGGLRRSFGLWASVLASSAVFAIVHPPFSAVPVFLLGVLAALAYEGTGLLIAPVMVHGVYNAAVLAQRLVLGGV